MSSDDDLILLAELTGYTDASTSTVYRFSTRKFWTEPTDTPPNEGYSDRIVDAGFLKRQLYFGGVSGARANPRSQVDYGAIVLTNIDGALDTVFGVASISFRERPIRLLKVRQGQPYSAAEVVYKAAISQVAMTRETVTISVKDRSYELNSPHLTTTYLGNNSLPAGVEGSADMAGKVKPKGYGKVFSFAPPCVNTSKQIYQVNVAAIQSVDVFDGASALTRGTDYTSQADMEATAPSPGYYRVWPAGGMFRLETKPTYLLTADVTYDTAADSTVAQILKRMATDRGIQASDISAADVTALDALNNAVVGIVIDDTRTTLDAMDGVALSIGASYYFDQFGVLRMNRFDEPSGTAVAVVANWADSTLEKVADGEDVPTVDVRLNYAGYVNPLSPGQIASSITGAVYSDVQQRYRVSQYAGTITPNPHKRTLVMERTTLLTTKSAADTEAQRLFNLVSVSRRTFVAKNVFLDDAALETIDINSVVELRWDRYGFDPVFGTLRRVIALTHYFSARRCDLTLWGA